MSDRVSFPGHVVEQWHPNNPPLESFRPGSNKKVRWICDLGHEWQAAICDRTRAKNTHCPYCSGARVLPGYNDLATTTPGVVHLWSPANVRDITAISSGSNYKALWDCDVCSHRWSAAVKSVAKLGSGCPKCSGRVARTGETDLQTMEPDLARAYSCSNPRSASLISRWSHEVVTWSCVQCAGEWTAKVSNVRSPLCRTCRKHEGSIARQRPELLTWWSPANDRTPQETPDQYTRTALWRCDQEHEWPASPAHFKPVCPECRRESQERDHEQRAQEREQRRQARLAAEEERARERKHRQQQRHERAQRIEQAKAERARQAKERSRRQEARERERAKQRRAASLAVKNPELAGQLHPDSGVEPYEEPAASGTKALWLGPCGHEWEARISDRYAKGSGCPFCSNNKVLAGFNDLATTHPGMAAQWGENNPLSAREVTAGSNRRIWWRCERGHTWQAAPLLRTQTGTGCPKCSNRVSRGEAELREFIESLVGKDKVQSNVRRVLVGNGRSELDIYLPDHGYAVEFNGVYWHSEIRGRSRKWEHHDKWRLCREQGVSLLAVWSDDWRERRTAVETMIAAKLGLSSARTVGARTCSVRDVAPDESREFFSDNHVQGPVQVVSYSYGLAGPGGELVAVLSVRRSGSSHTITRFATSCRVQGGFTRLLAQVKRRASAEGARSLVTFSDNAISDGGLYAASGFSLDAELDPDYSYVRSDARVHKFNYRRARFRDDPDLAYDPDLSESQLARLNGLTRVWDYGKTRWRMDLIGND